MTVNENAQRRAVAISSSELNAMLRAASAPVLVYVWAPWCPPCASMTPAMDEVAATIGKDLRVVKLNAASESQALTAFGIASVPTLLLFAADGREQARFLGALTSRATIEWVASNSRHEVDDQDALAVAGIGESIA